MKQYSFTISLLFSLLMVNIFTGCSTTTVTKQTVIQDMKVYKQQAQPYLKNIPPIPYYLQTLWDKQFNEQYFKPWHMKQLDLSLKDATWGNGYANKQMYGDNHKLLSQQWFNKHIKNSNFEAYNTKLQKAITVRNSNLRVFPTVSKLFYNPETSGEGFPFDYNQNSGIKINSALLISHYSKDKAWVFVQSSFATGWLKVDDIALVSEKLIYQFETNNYYIAKKDNFALYKNGIFKEYIKLGTLFPKTKSGKYLTINKDIHLNGFLSTVELNETHIAKKPLKLTAKNVKQIFNELILEPYGWGELLNHRDCSALTRDFIAPFGIYLPRNSAAQVNKNNYQDMRSLNNLQKKKKLLEHGIPFLTLVHIKGHVMLYIGQINKEPLVFHNVWGVKTLKNSKVGRFVVGQAIVSSLEMGKELEYYDASQSLLSKVEGFSHMKIIQ